MVVKRRAFTLLYAVLALTAGCALLPSTSDRADSWVKASDPYSIQTTIANRGGARTFLVKKTQVALGYCLLGTVEHLQFANGTSDSWKPILAFPSVGRDCLKPEESLSVTLVWPNLQHTFFVALSSVRRDNLALAADSGRFAEHFFDEVMAGGWRARTFSRSPLRTGLFDLTMTKDGEGADITLSMRIRDGKVSIEDVSASLGP